MEEERQEHLLSGQSLEVPPHCLWGGEERAGVCVCVCACVKEGQERVFFCVRSVYRGLFHCVSREGSLPWWALEGGEQHSVRWLTSSFYYSFSYYLETPNYTKGSVKNFWLVWLALSLPLPLSVADMSALKLEDRGQSTPESGPGGRPLF